MCVRACRCVDVVTLGTCACATDVQVTRDGVPVLYHDWRVHETGFELPVWELTAGLLQVRPLHRRTRGTTHNRMTLG
jgi:glycerophosphoryl diester phosphodiesterase